MTAMVVEITLKIMTMIMMAYWIVEMAALLVNSDGFQIQIQIMTMMAVKTSVKTKMTIMTTFVIQVGMRTGIAYSQLLMQICALKAIRPSPPYYLTMETKMVAKTETKMRTTITMVSSTNKTIVQSIMD